VFASTTNASGEIAPEQPIAAYTNPVRAKDCPDPGVLRVDRSGMTTYFMACTSANFGILESKDLVHWADTGGAILPSGRAPWSANGGRNWAPEIHEVGNRYVAYFTAANANDKLAIGVAWADAPTGPYSVAPKPLVDDPNPGVIDATFFRDDDGRQYLYWKRDGNAVGARTPILVRELTADGLGFVQGSTATEVLNNDEASFEGPLVEAPYVIKRGGAYYMFYSANAYDDRYRTAVARASSPKGPFLKRALPLLSNNAKFRGPGHGSIVRFKSSDMFVYHAWVANNPDAGRQLLIDPIVWEDGWPRIGDGTPSLIPQPLPN